MKQRSPWVHRLAAVVEAWQTSTFLSRLRQRTPLGWVASYGLAVGAVAVAFSLRQTLTAWVGPDLPAYITFYPAVMVVALLAGFGPGLVSTLLAGLAAALWILPPVGQFSIASPADRLSLAIFLGMGLLMSTVAELYKRNRSKAAAYDREAALRASREALRESEERYRHLFNTIDEGFCIVEMIFDADDKPTDYRFIEVNAAFEKQTGLHQAQGKRMRELAPAHETHWFEIYGKIALTGEPARFVQEAKALHRWYDVYAYRVGKPENRQVAILFGDISRHKRAEEVLRQKEAELTEAQRIAHVGNWHWDAKTDVTTGSGELLRIFGLDPATQRMPDFKEQRGLCYPVDDWERVNAAVQWTVRTGLGYELDVRAIRDGAPIWITTRGEAVRDIAGKIAGLRGTIQDITERKLREERIAKLTRLYAVLSQVNEAIVRARDAEALYSEVCRIVAETGRFTLAWIGEVREHRVVPLASWGPGADYAKEIKVELEGALGNGPTGTCIRENRTVFIDDFAINPTTSPWREAAQRYGIRASAAFPLRRQGKPIGALTLYAPDPNTFDEEQVGLLESLSADLSYALDAIDHEQNRIRTEQALRESETRFRNIFDHAATGIAITDCSGRFVQCNAAYCGLTGYSEGELAATDFPSLIHPEDREHNLGFIRQLLHGELPSFEIENRYVHKDGGLVWVRKYVSLLRDDRGQPTHVVALVTDTTERKQTENLFRFLAQCGISGSGEGFFQDLARYLAQTFDVDFVCIDRLEEDKLSARTLAVFHNGQFEDNVSYALKDTPCGEVVGRRICCFPRNVREMFPKDEVLQKLQAESYLGATLWSAQGKPIGLIAVVGRQPLANARLAESLLQVVAVRAAGELERQQVEEALRLAHERLALAQQSAGAGVWDWDLTTEKLEWSPELFLLFGLDPAQPQVTLDTWLRIMHPDDRQAAEERVRSAIQNHVHLVNEYRIVLASGEDRWISALGDTVYDESGRPLRMSGICVDITDLKRAEEALRESEERHQLATGVAKEAIWEVNLKTGTTHWNRAYTELFGRPEEATAHGPWWISRIHPDDRERVNDSFAKVLAEGGDSWTCDYRMKMADDSYAFLNDRAIIVRDKSGSPLRAVGSKLNVTDRKRAEDALLEAKAAAEAANEAKSRFLANISHELRTPMNAILGMIELALPKQADPTATDFLETARESADLLLALLNDLLDSAKIEAGKMDLDSAPFSLRSVLDQTSQVLSVRASEKGISFSCHIAPEVPDALVGDQVRLRQILLNLAGNGIKFTESGEVAVRVRVESQEAEEARLEFAVQDTGIGIPSSDLELIFRPFTQVDPSASRRFGGTGLGLPICSSLVGAMDGRIWVESEPGHGSTFFFTVRLPLAGELPAVPIVHQVPDSATSILRILLVEDNPANQKLATYILQDRGHVVEIAGDGRQAIRMTEENDYDVILMDLQMPGMDGLEATAAIRKHEAEKGTGPICRNGPEGASHKLDQSPFPRMPIIAMTAHAMKADRQRCLAGGMDGYLSKPIDAHEMIALVESLATGAAAADTGTASRTPLPAEPAKLPTPLLFDPKEALKRCLNKPDLLEQMIAFFFMDVDNLIPQMQAALRKGDLPEVGRLGHRLKGTLGHIAAEPAREAALRVEHFLLHEGQQTEAEKAVRALEEECKILRAALIEHQAASGPMQERR